MRRAIIPTGNSINGIGGGGSGGNIGGKTSSDTVSMASTTTNHPFKRRLSVFEATLFSARHLVSSDVLVSLSYIAARRIFF
ncbi:hypothetical protein C2S51_016779 [Perilla frutescens var. frutescens]|nr:hypothetical protein C2S51_016779 [Perilla frutescens var. frutescens]